LLGVTDVSAQPVWQQIAICAVVESNRTARALATGAVVAGVGGFLSHGRDHDRLFSPYHNPLAMGLGVGAATMVLRSLASPASRLASGAVNTGIVCAVLTQLANRRAAAPYGIT
jgi:hypothetical protein